MPKKQATNLPPKKLWRANPMDVATPVLARVRGMIIGSNSSLAGFQYQSGGRKILPPAEEVRILTNIVEIDQKPTSETVELSRDKIDEIRAAAMIGFKQAVADVAAIRAEVFGKKILSNDASHAIASVSEPEPEKR
jgi:hypothetical protein